MEIRPSLRRHGQSDDDIRWAVEHALAASDVDTNLDVDVAAVLYLGPNTDGDLLEQLADEAEHGDTPEQLRRRGRPRPAKGRGSSHSLNVRIDDDLRDELADRARREGHTTSEVVREALRRYLAS